MTNKTDNQSASETIHLALHGAIVDYCKRHYIDTNQFNYTMDSDNYNKITHEQEYSILNRLDIQAKDL